MTTPRRPVRPRPYQSRYDGWREPTSARPGLELDDDTTADSEALPRLPGQSLAGGVEQLVRETTGVVITTRAHGDRLPKLAATGERPPGPGIEPVDRLGGKKHIRRAERALGGRFPRAVGRRHRRH